MKTIMYPAVTLDGFIADKDGECYQWINSDDEAEYDSTVREAGCLLVGRKTFEQYPEDYPKAGAITFVYSRHIRQSKQQGVEFVHGTPEEVIKQISAQGFTHLIIGGGGETNGIMAAAGLVDEIIISVYGIVLGEGIPLFGSYKPNLNLKLLTSRHDQGIVKNHYRVIR